MQNINMIVKMVFGSHLYGLSTPDSDIDYSGIYLPTLDELLLGSYKKVISYTTGNNNSKNTSADVDSDIFALPYFMELALKGETRTIDMLHATDVDLDPVYGDIWNDLVRNRKMFYTKNLSSYMGYVKHQAAKYGIRGSRIAGMREAIAQLAQCQDSSMKLNDVWDLLPINDYCKKIILPKKNAPGEMEDFYEINAKKYARTNRVDYVLERVEKALSGYGERALLAEKNEGVDWKAISHALRAGYQMRGIYRNGDFEYPLPETDFIKQVKAGTLDYKTEVSPVLEELVDEVDDLTAKADMPERADREYWNDWLVSVYRTTFNISEGSLDD